MRIHCLCFPCKCLEYCNALLIPAPGTVSGAAIRPEKSNQEVVKQQRIVWTGNTLVIEATHQWNFSFRDGVTHVSTEEEFKGFLAWLLPGTMRNTIAQALNHGVQVLKYAAESKH